ncbi:hypothetical protein ACWT_4137 [Actinoplanes sp. SE50]|uniref:hypothetical protein n=1 Tax=unclassified Actinoplanes TaxID=2626549 RepID=UPI00023EBF48|nr:MULTISPECIES: hypothetical protein [unclassified Actinoplanes]AEV85159.1 hypothetical protein ACPL_4266 [Actinoplanes sp. SE50/110]ATO83552.1 hypothetical protein ACWT_4137 [Actinoplanes sp. SE50]SLM00959.1 hypothetical protein ACSP50_4192 [Actinoplanes sp. SE50/110]
MTSTSSRITTDDAQAHWYEERAAQATSPWMFSPADDQATRREPLWSGSCHDARFTTVQGHDSVWVLATAGDGARTALRVAYCPGGLLRTVDVEPAGSGVRLRVESAIGTFRTEIALPDSDVALLHATTTLTPAATLSVPYWPRDLIPLGDGDALTDSAGRVYAYQEGVRTGCVHFSVTRPEGAGSIYYFQNLTALNDYAEQTTTSLAGVVGGAWPELGLSLPVSVDNPLRAGQETVLSDAYVLFWPSIPDDDTGMAEQFLDSLARILLLLPHREPAYMPWPDIAEKALRDLSQAAGCSTRIDGHRFLNAYVGDVDTPPESMVQLAVLLPLLEYAEWRGDEIALTGELLDGLPGFFDDEAGVMGRWLMARKDRLDGSEPQKKPGTMDSWYLYHSLLNLARLARHGDRTARRLFLDSMDFAVEVAHHFEYRWPVLYDMYTLDVEVARSGEDEAGESDVAGLYVHVMLEAFELTQDRRFVTEATVAADRLAGLGMRMFYQANVTMFGCAALLRLAELTGEQRFRRLSYVALASAFNNTWTWECDYGHAAHYPTFLAMLPLRAAPYIAVMEAIEAFSAVQYYLRSFSEPMPSWMTVLLPQFCRGLLERAAFYYPQNLPDDVISDEQESGSLDARLWIPLEDLRDGWERPGQVGQEVYGAGVPFALVPRQYRRIPEAGLLVFTDYPIAAFTVGTGRATLRVTGDARFTCRLLLIPDDPDRTPQVSVSDAADGGLVPADRTSEGYLDHRLRGDQAVIIRWQPTENEEHVHDRHRAEA